MLFFNDNKEINIKLNYDDEEFMNEFTAKKENNLTINILPYDAVIYSKHGPRIKFLTPGGENDFEVKIAQDCKIDNIETVPDNLNHKQKKILKKYEDNIFASSSLIYKYGMEELSDKEYKIIERAIKQLW